MSASLVGSEMCIRDRFPPEETQVWTWGGPSLGPTWALSKVAGARTEAPVSYTHLTLPTICSV
eukprot:6933538-Alexandrium_andersonii.AAC.1